jgi:hypothetical protein
MKYITHDGVELISSPNEAIIHESDAQGYPEGVYTSYETAGSANQYGIQQIKIVRTVVGDSMTYTITESTDKELESYLSEITAL